MIKTLNEGELRRRYTRRYMLAMGLIAACILAGTLHLKQALELSRQQAEIVNVAAAQRMLSQRLALLPNRILSETYAFRRDRALNDMRVALNRMRAGHEFLTLGTPQQPAPAQATAQLVRHYAPEGGGLNQMTLAYIRAFEQFLDAPYAISESLEYQRINAETGLLNRLDRALAMYTTHAETTTTNAIRLHAFWAALSLALLGLVVAFIFRPMARDAASSVANIGARLDERTRMLSQSFKIAKMGHWRANNAQADPLWISQELLDLYGMGLKEGWHPLAVMQAGDVVSEATDVASNTQHLAFKQTWQTGKPTIARSQFRTSSGAIIDILTHMDAEFDADGNVVSVVGVSKDDTAEADADRALKQSYDVIERKTRDLVEAQRLGRLASWRLPLNGELVEWDERAFEMMHCDPQTFVPTLQSVASFYVGDSRKRAAALGERVITTGERQSETLQVKRGDGSIIDIYLRSTLERDEAGNPVALFGTMQDVTKERAAARELEQLAYFDNLTGLANRTLFTRELKRVSDASKNTNHKAALLLLDLDHFKEVNDTLGHQAGDQLLGIIGQRLSSVIERGNFVARLGGDEFAIIVEDDISQERLDDLCRRIIASINVSANLSLGTVQTNASIGVALLPENSREPDELMRFADLALYASKEKGRGRATYYMESFSLALGTRLSLASEIRSALDEGRFEAHYQPLVNLRTGLVSGFECLLRLPKADGGFIPPSEFIPIAESSHLIADLGSFVMHAACHEAQSWVEAGLPARSVSVNVSAAQVWHGDLEQIVDSALEKSGLDPELLCIELTESVFAADSLSRLEGILSRLKARGIALALDDFGTGYSSLGYLNRLPFDKLKIDRTFVSGANLCPEKRKMLRGVVSLGKGLDLDVTAEGVETIEELKLVRALGVNSVQGWYFSKAMPGEQAIVEASRIDARAQLTPLNARDQERRHRDVVMDALLRRPG